MLLQNFCHRIASQGAATDLKNTTKWGKTVNRIMFHHPLNVTSCCSSSSATICVFNRQQSRTRASAASSIIVSFPGRRKEKPKMGPTTLLHNSRLEFTLNNDFHFFFPLSFFLSFFRHFHSITHKTMRNKKLAEFRDCTEGNRWVENCRKNRWVVRYTQNFILYNLLCLMAF